MNQSLLILIFSTLLSVAYSQSWEIVGNQSYGHGYYDLQELEMINNVPHIIYTDYNDGYLYMTKYENNMWSDPANSMVSDDAGSAFRSVTDTNGVIYVAYHDGSVGGDISVKKWNGTTWEFVGAQGFGVDAVSGYSMEISCLSDNSIIVAYAQNSSIIGGHGFLDVRRFNGSTWEYLGQDVAGEQVGYLSLGVLSTDEIYINYRTIGYDSKTVKYDGMNWNVLTTPFDSDTIYRSFIAVGGNDEILAWRVNYNQSAYEFFTVNNDVWQPITSPNHVTTSDPLDYNWAIEYCHNDSSWYAGFTAHPVDQSFLKKFDGTTWSQVGDSVDYSIGGFRYSDLEFDLQGIPFYTSGVVYNLMTLNPTPVGIVEHMVQGEFTFYPNPSNGIIHFTFMSHEALFTLHDINGTEILSRKVSPNESINLSQYSKGIYFVTMDGTTKRLILN